MLSQVVHFLSLEEYCFMASWEPAATFKAVEFAAHARRYLRAPAAHAHCGPVGRAGKIS